MQAFTVADLDSDPLTWNGGKMGWIRAISSSTGKPDDQAGVGVLHRYQSGASSVVHVLFFGHNNKMYTRRWSGTAWSAWKSSFDSTNKPAITDVTGLPDALVQAGGAPVLSTAWVQLRTAMWSGYTAGDGQLLKRADYPDAWAAIQAGKVPVVSDADWLADPLKRGSFTTGDGATTFRVPDYNGKCPGSIGALFQRGDGLNAATACGLLQGDVIRNITGGANAAYNWGLVTDTARPFGAFHIGSETDSPNIAGGGVTTTIGRWLKFDASRVVPTGLENRPVAVTGCWAVKLFGAVQNAGSIDAAALATQLAEAQSRIAELESWPQSGSTANGTWIKHKDGTMTATAFLIGYGVAVQSAVGSLFQSAEVINIPLPAGFISRPAYSISIEYSAGTVRPFPIPIESTVSKVSCVLQSGISTPSVICNFVVMASGRWK